MRAFRLSAAALCLSAAFLSFPSAYAAEPAAQEVISASSSYLQSIQWDAEYDVVIAGYGFSRAAGPTAAAGSRLAFWPPPPPPLLLQMPAPTC